MVSIFFALALLIINKFGNHSGVTSGREGRLQILYIFVLRAAKVNF